MITGMIAISRNRQRSFSKTSSNRFKSWAETLDQILAINIVKSKSNLKVAQILKSSNGYRAPRKIDFEVAISKDQNRPGHGSQSVLPR